MSGAEVLVWIRANIAEPVPVLFVTARQREEDIVHALSSGADDYMVKPLGRLELLARIDALARRTRPGPSQSEDALEYGRLSVDCRNRRVRLDGEEVAMTQKDYELACSCCATSAVCCRAATFWKRSGGSRPKSIRARLTRMSAASAANFSSRPKTDGAFPRSISTATGSSGSRRMRARAEWRRVVSASQDGS